MEDKSKISAALGQHTSFSFDIENYRQDYAHLLGMRSISPLERWLNQPITVQSVADCLSFFYEDQAVGLLLYFHDNDTLKIWLLSAQGIHYTNSVPLLAASLAEMEDQLRRGLMEDASHSDHPMSQRMGRKKFSSSVSGIDTHKVIQKISNYLLPVELVTEIHQLAIEHLLIVPCVNIQQIPFAILPLAGTNEQFIDRWSHSFAFSLFELADLMLRKGINKNAEAFSLTQEDLTKGRSLFVANPNFSSNTEWSLAPLPGAETEVREISEQLIIPEAQVLIGEAATKAAIAQKCRKARLLYFATHGVASEDEPLDGSGLFLTPSSSDSTGLWTAREIQNMQLNASLVILSACQTGLGAAQDAGIIGLSRAFHLAGAGSVITSLWSVDDTTTKELMKIFMEELQQPHAFFPSAHLRAAMLRFREKYPSPYHWAAFAVMGIA